MKRKEIDPAGVRTYPLRSRDSKVGIPALGTALPPGASIADFLAGLPDVLAARELLEAAREIAGRHRAGGTIVLGMGAHPIKVGLGPLIVDLIERGVVSAIAMNGAGIIHDFELAAVGHTSEEVGERLTEGRFGMAEETATVLNEAARTAAATGIGLGEAVGRAMQSLDLPYAAASILVAGVRCDLPITVHVALGTDTLHMHPSADGAAIGAATLRDFRILASAVSELEGGAFLNLGSAVIVPEVFLKALSLARNLGHRVNDVFTLDMDFQRQYRPLTNVVTRPTLQGGRGIHLTGHHEIMFPLLRAALLEELTRSEAAR